MSSFPPRPEKLPRWSRLGLGFKLDSISTILSNIGHRRYTETLMINAVTANTQQFYVAQSLCVSPRAVMLADGRAWQRQHARQHPRSVEFQNWFSRQRGGCKRRAMRLLRKYPDEMCPEPLFLAACAPLVGGHQLGYTP